MHKSRLAGFIIDCESGDLDDHAGFWSAALGYPLRPDTPPADVGRYVGLDAGADGLSVEVQKVTHPSRVHLDIETDDIEAEAARLEQLGARRIESIRGWLVMEAPSGHRFCLIKPQSADFAERANRWDPVGEP